MHDLHRKSFVYTLFYVLQVNLDKHVAVRSTLLMESAQRMEYLVHDDALVFTPPANGDALTSTCSTNVRVAAAFSIYK